MGAGGGADGDGCPGVPKDGPRGGPLDRGIDPETGAGFTGFPRKVGRVDTAEDSVGMVPCCDTSTRGEVWLDEPVGWTFRAMLATSKSMFEDSKAIEGVWYVGKLGYSTVRPGVAGTCVVSALGSELLPGVP